MVALHLQADIQFLRRDPLVPSICFSPVSQAPEVEQLEQTQAGATSAPAADGSTSLFGSLASTGGGFGAVGPTTGGFGAFGAGLGGGGGFGGFSSFAATGSSGQGEGVCVVGDCRVGEWKEGRA